MTTAKGAPAKAAPVKKRGGLGRGLEALLGPKGAAQAPVLEATPADTLRHLPVDALAPGKYQPRKTMDQAKLAELAESIKAQGVIQPIVVRDLGGRRIRLPRHLAREIVEVHRAEEGWIRLHVPIPSDDERHADRAVGGPTAATFAKIVTMTSLAPLIMALTLVAAAPASTLAQARATQPANPTIRVFEGAG